MANVNFGICQNVWIKGKTVNYYNDKKIKGVTVSIVNNENDSLVNSIYSKGKFKIQLNQQGIYRVVFSKEGFIEKHFLINSSSIPKYYLDKKYTIQTEMSMTQKDKYMESNTLNSAVGYVYYNKKYRGFIWDAEFTKKAQLAMDVQIFPLDEVVKLDSALNRSSRRLYFQKGINYYINIKSKPEQFFKEALIYRSKSKIKDPVLKGYYYGKMTDALLKDDLTTVNSLAPALKGTSATYISLAEALKDCKNLDTLVLNSKYAAVGYWMNLVNYTDTSDIIAFVNISNTLKIIEKEFVSIEMTDAELSFYSDFKNCMKAVEQLSQKIKNSTQSELDNPESYQYQLDGLKEKVRVLAKNCELLKD